MANGKLSQQELNRLLGTYSKKLTANDILVSAIYIYGSYAKGTAKKGSDVDICVISPSFQDRVESTMTLMKLRDDNELILSPIAFSPKSFVDENPLAWEVKQTGKIYG